MATVITVAALRKSFGPTRALDGLDLEVAPGEVHGFLGPNGAGKTTTIRILLGLLRADGGHGAAARRRPLARRRRAAPPPGLRARRRRTCGPTSPAARSSTCSAGCAAASTRSRRAALLERFELDPTKKAPRLLQGQPPEGRPGRGAGVRRRAAPARRAHLRPRPADGGGVPGRACSRSAARGPHRAAVEPHPRRGRDALRPGHHHPPGPRRETGTLAELRHLTRTACTPSVDGDAGRAGRACPACTTWRRRRRPRRLRGRPGHARRRAAAPGRARRAHPRQPAAHARGPVPAPLRRGARRGRPEHRRRGAGRGGPDHRGETLVEVGPTTTGDATWTRSWASAGWCGWCSARPRAPEPVDRGPRGADGGVGRPGPSLYRDPARLSSTWPRWRQPGAGHLRRAGLRLRPPERRRDPRERDLLWMALGCALMSVFLVNRHTRAEEDSERADLIRSLVVGRHAPATAALVVAALGQRGRRRRGRRAPRWPSGSSRPAAWPWRRPIGLVGLVFAAVTAVAAQVAGSGRAALGLGAGAVALAFVVRGVGDVASGPGVAHAVRVGHRGAGVRRRAMVDAPRPRRRRRRRDAGLVRAVVAPRPGQRAAPQHAGRAEAARWTTHPLGLAFRLQRGAAHRLGRRPVRGRPRVRLRRRRRGRHAGRQPRAGDYLAQLGGASVTDSYLATALRLLALLASGYALWRAPDPRRGARGTPSRCWPPRSAAGGGRAATCW